MGFVSISYLENLVSQQIRSTPLGTNHDIYDNRLTHPHPPVPFQYVPRRIYFYYLTLDADAAPTAEHYRWDNKDSSGAWIPITEADLPSLVTNLVANARGNKDKPAPHGQNFIDVIWKHKSYIVILIDEDGWSFHTRAGGQTAATFNVDKGSTPNHSFFDAFDLRLQIGGKDRHAIAFINHMKRNADGDDIQDGEEQDFVFDGYVDVKYRGASDFLTVILDPGGTNQGPPEMP